MNLTDVGHMTDDSHADGGGADKMQQATTRIKGDKKSGKLPPGATIDNPDDPFQIANYYTQAFLDDARKLSTQQYQSPIWVAVIITIAR